MGKYGTSFIKWSQVCQGSVRTHKHINYLAAVSLRGRREVGTGGEAMTGPRTDIINYHGGASGPQDFILFLYSRSKISFQVPKPSLGI